LADSYEGNQERWGQTEGSGLERTYVTKPGDTLEDIASYFYGDPAQRQRLIDDNPDLARWQPGDQVPGGTRITVGEDEARGDSVTRAE
jgi:phage tail protein X